MLINVRWDAYTRLVSYYEYLLVMKSLKFYDDEKMTIVARSTIQHLLETRTDFTASLTLVQCDNISFLISSSNIFHTPKVVTINFIPFVVCPEHEPSPRTNGATRFIFI